MGHGLHSGRMHLSVRRVSHCLSVPDVGWMHWAAVARKSEITGWSNFLGEILRLKIVFVLCSLHTCKIHLLVLSADWQIGTGTWCICKNFVIHFYFLFLFFFLMREWCKTSMSRCSHHIMRNIWYCARTLIFCCWFLLIYFFIVIF